jgi:N-acetylglucosamine-6-phosphate deacetylase
LNDLPEGETDQLDGGILSAGFIDAQVNGGGGRMLNDEPSPASMYTIAAGHRPYGTTSLLPTLITDTAEATAAAIEAAKEAVKANRGVAGLHLEGPHLAPARKGAHLAELMRPVEDSDVKALQAAQAIGTLLVTMAAEQVTAKQVRQLSEAGVIVSIGHSDCSSEAAEARFDAGARGVTHLFNAMSQLGHRTPGLVGAASTTLAVWCGIIADGHHVDPKALRTALRAKRGEGKLFFVTDAMSLVGSRGQLHAQRPHRSARDGAASARSWFCRMARLPAPTSIWPRPSATASPISTCRCRSLRMATLYPRASSDRRSRPSCARPARRSRAHDRWHRGPADLDQRRACVTTPLRLSMHH